MSDDTPPEVTPAPERRRPGRKPKPKPISIMPQKNLDHAPERPPLREDDPRAAAARRAAEILGNFDGTELQGNADEFVLPKAPDGWSYEWKFKSCLNQEDPGRMMGYRRTGWHEVPYKRHPEMMPVGYKGADIERKGMILMERPQEVTDRFKERDRINARNQVRTKEEQLNYAPQGQFDRNNKDAPLARVSKGFEPMPIPADK